MTSNNISFSIHCTRTDYQLAPIKLFLGRNKHIWIISSAICFTTMTVIWDQGLFFTLWIYIDNQGVFGQAKNVTSINGDTGINTTFTYKRLYRISCLFLAVKICSTWEGQISCVQKQKILFFQYWCELNPEM